VEGASQSSVACGCTLEELPSPEPLISSAASAPSGQKKAECHLEVTYTKSPIGTLIWKKLGLTQSGAEFMQGVQHLLVWIPAKEDHHPFVPQYEPSREVLHQIH